MSEQEPVIELLDAECARLLGYPRGYGSRHVIGAATEADFLAAEQAIRQAQDEAAAKVREALGPSPAERGRDPST